MVQNSKSYALLATLLDELRVEMIGPIRQELLSGISDKNQYDSLKLRLNAFIDIPIETKDFELAAEFANICRSHGIQGSPTDFQICAIASTYKLAILTEDKDFERYAQHLPITLHGREQTLPI
ncbi:MAG: PIN domain-containing protein [Coriobacteriales bacterium]|nr:PIN domain-containing protein [Coriobacteriales bacterium]